jgi:lysophospholipase L1-like esterase
MVPMRRFYTWYLPLIAAVAFAVVFAWGVVAGLRGNVGEIVGEAPAAEGSFPRAERERDEVFVVLLGDSLARGTGDEMGLGIGGHLEEVLRRDGSETVEVVNLAVNGATTEHLLGLIEQRNVAGLIGRASHLVISIGGNDFFGEAGRFGVPENPPEDPQALIATLQDRIESVVDSVRQINGEATIFLIGLYNPFRAIEQEGSLSPMVSQWNAALQHRFEHDPAVVIVQTSDLFLERDRLSADRFHPNAEAYRLIARRILDVIAHDV